MCICTYVFNVGGNVKIRNLIKIQKKNKTVYEKVLFLNQRNTFFFLETNFFFLQAHWHRSLKGQNLLIGLLMAN